MFCCTGREITSSPVAQDEQHSGIPNKVVTRNSDGSDVIGTCTATPQSNRPARSQLCVSRLTVAGRAAMSGLPVSNGFAAVATLTWLI